MLKYIVIIEDAPPENNCKNTICEAPPKIINEVANVSSTLKPNSIPIAPKIIPNGTTGINKGKTSIMPFTNNLDFFIILMSINQNKQYDQYE